MLEDNEDNFEFDVFKECKIVRERLIDKYNELNKQNNLNLENSNIDIYASLNVK